MSFQPQQRSYLIHNECHNESQCDHNEEYIKEKSLVHGRPPFKKSITVIFFAFSKKRHHSYTANNSLVSSPTPNLRKHTIQASSVLCRPNLSWIKDLIMNIYNSLYLLYWLYYTTYKLTCQVYFAG